MYGKVHYNKSVVPSFESPIDELQILRMYRAFSILPSRIQRKLKLPIPPFGGAISVAVISEDQKIESLISMGKNTHKIYKNKNVKKELNGSKRKTPPRRRNCKKRGHSGQRLNGNY